LIDDKIIQEHR